MKFGKASNRRLALAAVPRESSAADRLLDNSRQMVPLALIDDNPRNPRTRMDEESVGELAASIAEHGLLQAPVVRRHPDDPGRYMVVLGSRRVAAHRLLGRDEIEVIVRRLDDRQAFLASCVENVQRVELSPREEMDMIGVLVDELGSQEAAARALGKSPT
jgi:ParB family chromosome partitioning protein